jgi:hypothetical protein
VERMIEEFDLNATIRRASSFMQNDPQLKDALLGHGVYPMPMGSVGVWRQSERLVRSSRSTAKRMSPALSERLSCSRIRVTIPDTFPLAHSDSQAAPLALQSASKFQDSLEPSTHSASIAREVVRQTNPARQAFRDAAAVGDWRNLCWQ